MEGALPQILWLVLMILIAGVLVWAINQIPAIDETFKKVAIVILVVCLAIYALIVIFTMLTGVAPPLRVR